MRSLFAKTALLLSATLPTLLSSPLQAQPPSTATVSIIGQACSTPEGTPQLTVRGLPVLGTTFSIDYAGPNHELDNTQSIAQPHLVIGFAALGPATIPQSLFFQQPAGCTLDTTQEIVLPMPPSQRQLGTFEGSLSIPVSNDPVLLGINLFAQWLTPHTQCGFAGCGPGFSWVGTSETAVITVGT